MPCGITCTIALIIIVSKLIMTFSVANDPRIKQYENQFTPELRQVYKKIASERLSIYIQGYTLGIVLSILFLVYNTQYAKRPTSVISMVCIVIIITFFVSYYYYILSPKTDWVLNHVKEEKDSKAWLQVYRAMQYHCHSAFAIGLVGVGVLAYAFRGSCANV
jgi:ABC-type dipeptide/oligopeptide/nickel transport system permease component